MLSFILFITTFILALIQETAFSFQSLVPWLIALGYTNIKRDQLLILSFSSGIFADLIRGTTLGISSLWYIALLSLVFIVFARIKHSNIIAISIIVACFSGVHNFLFIHTISFASIILMVILFWTFLPFTNRLLDTNHKPLTLQT